MPVVPDLAELGLLGEADASSRKDCERVLRRTSSGMNPTANHTSQLSP